MRGAWHGARWLMLLALVAAVIPELLYLAGFFAFFALIALFWFYVKAIHPLVRENKRRHREVVESVGGEEEYKRILHQVWLHEHGLR